MKKSIILLVLLCLFVLGTSVVSAGPAPNLSKVSIYSLGSEYSGWKGNNNNTTVSGENLCICVQFTGYPSGNVIIYQNGSVIPQNSINMYGQQNINNGIVKYYKIPYSALSIGKDGYMGTVRIQANGFNSTFTDYVSNVSFIYK